MNLANSTSAFKITMMKLRALITIITAVTLFMTAWMPAIVVSADEIPSSSFIEGVVGNAQNHRLSCEARSAADVASFWGVDFTEEEFMEKIPKSDNPNKGFVGNMDDYWGNIPPKSYGVHAAPVVKTLKKMGLKARNETGMGKNDLKREIAAGRPVIVWIIGQVWKGKLETITIESGDEVNVARYEHTMILTGYNKDSVYLIDAFSGGKLSYSWTSFMSTWSVLGNMAVVVDGKKDAPSPTPTPNKPNVTKPSKKTYTVQPGDYLTAIAKKYNLDWRKLAEINHINYPWIIHPGQVLKLK
jgi:uncharacterized protein YvpB